MAQVSCLHSLSDGRRFIFQHRRWSSYNNNEAATNPAIALRLQTQPLVGQVVALGSRNMTTISPILACGSLNLDAGTAALIYFVLGGWLLSFVLAFANPLLIAFLSLRPRYKATHYAIYAVNLGSGLFLISWASKSIHSDAFWILLFGIPILAISHFIALLWILRQTRRRKQTTNAAPTVKLTAKSPPPSAMKFF